MVPGQLLVLAFIAGVLFGRWVWAMRRIGELHARVHARASANAEANANTQVVVMTPDAVRGLDGRFVIADALPAGAGHFELASTEGHELLWADEFSDAQVVES